MMEQWKNSFNKTIPHRKVSCLQTRHNQLHHTGMAERQKEGSESLGILEPQDFI